MVYGAQYNPGKPMPLTPLHLAAGLPCRKWASLKSFILVNLLIDLEPGAIMFFGMDGLGYNLHQGIHSFGGATLMIGITLLIWTGFKANQFKHWMMGAILGGYSHIFLDSLVHHDVTPFGPIMQGNPLFLDAYHSVSLLCTLILAYYLARWVESLRIGEVWPRLVEDIRRRFTSSSK